MPANRTPTSLATLPALAIRGLGGMLLVGACCGALPRSGQATTPAASTAAESAVSHATSGPTYQPKPQETLDQVIAHTLAGSPLKIELLRQAFVAQNPQAFTPGKQPRLRKGVTLTVPDHEALLRMHLGGRTTPTIADPLLPARAAPSTAEERKRWVQFP